MTRVIYTKEESEEVKKNAKEKGMNLRKYIKFCSLNSNVTIEIEKTHKNTPLFKKEKKL